jgi:thioesterase domain-containing protein
MAASAATTSATPTAPATVAALPTDLTCVVGIQPGGSQTPMFCVTGAGGGVFVFEPLARRLGADRPFYGLQLPGVDGRETPMDDIPALAARLVAEIRRVQPHGPDVLGGLCAGGSISFEMAQQLRAAGESIELLVLMDTLCPVVRGPLARRAMRWSLFHRTGLHVEAFRQRGAKAQLDYARGMWTKFRKRGYRLRPRRKNVRRSADEVAWQNQLKRANRKAQASYEPRPYPGKIVHFIQSASPIVSPRDRRARWDDVAEQPIDLHIVPGSHVGILSEENVAEMATLLCRYLAGYNGHASEDTDQAS